MLFKFIQSRKLGQPRHCAETTRLITSLNIPSLTSENSIAFYIAMAISEGPSSDDGTGSALLGFHNLIDVAKILNFKR